MFWTVAGGLFALVLLAAWLYDRRAKQRHGMRGISGHESPRHGGDGLTEKMNHYGVGGERQFGGVGGNAGGSPLGG